MSNRSALAVEADALKRQYVTFRVQSKRYGVPIESVAEMTQVRDVDPIAGAPTWILGMMQLRSSLVPILDLRLILGMARLEDDIESMLADLTRHRQAHVARLRSLAGESLPDPVAEPAGERGDCALRLWIEAAETADAHLAGPIARLKAPDQRLHAQMEHLRELAARSDRDGLHRRVAQIESAELRDLLEACEGAARDLRSRARRMVVVLRGARENLGVAVDHIDSVASVEVDEILPRPLHELAPEQTSGELLVASVVRKHDQSSLFQILDVARVFRAAGVLPVEVRGADAVAVPSAA